MKSAWRDRDADELVTRSRDQGVASDLALRVYTTRLLGRDPLLVMHGGGNTSLKTTERDLFGEQVSVLRVKVPAGIWPRSKRPACPRSASNRC